VGTSVTKVFAKTDRNPLYLNDLRAGALGGEPKSLTINDLRIEKKVKKKLAIFHSCAILFPVSERKSNEINKMNNENEMVQNDNSTELVSCCGCGEELRISQEEAANWNDLDRFQCHECE